MFLSLFLVNSITFISLYGVHYYINLLFLTPRYPPVKPISLTILSGILVSFSSTLLSIQQINQFGYIRDSRLLVVATSFYIIGYLLTNHLLFPNISLFRLLLLFCIFEMMLKSIDLFVLFLLRASTLYSHLLAFSMPLANLISNSVVLIVSFFILKLLKTCHIDIYIKNLFAYRKLSFIIILSFFIVDTWIDLSSSASLIVLFTAFSSYFILILFSSYLFFSITQESRLMIVQKQLEQQAIYSDHLEKVQKEIRTIHQRYKSIVNKLYQASLVKDTSIIRQTIHDDLLNIDQTIFHNLKQTNQLVKIEFVELKGLILTKIMTAEKQDIELFIEVPETIHSIAMETPDILCCLGILIDNAIEESANSTQQALTLVLYKEPSMLTIIVKNPFKKSPNLNKIWQEGYSTKGSNRGLGLSNLRQIINHYQNVFIDTQIEQDQFVQRLMIEQ